MATDGRITLQGRASDMIISGGENIYPKEIELVLDEIDGVTESASSAFPTPTSASRWWPCSSAKGRHSVMPTSGLHWTPLWRGSDTRVGSR